MKRDAGRLVFFFGAMVLAAVLLATCSPIPLATALKDLSTPVQVWKYSHKLTATSDLVANAAFGYAVSISSDYAIVGAYGEASNAGAAYIFARSGTTWTKLKRITPSVPIASSRFGAAVSIDGSNAIVGAYNSDIAYVFSKDQGGVNNWGQAKAISGTASTLFGYAVGIKGLHAIVGAFNETSGKGAAHLYFRDQGGANNWGLVADVLDGTGVAGDNLGYSVAISDNYAAAGAPNSTNGLAVVYQKITDTNWGNAVHVAASDGAAGDQFGQSIALTDTDLVAGAAVKQYAYAFARTGSSWGETARLFLTPPSQVSDLFGSSVCIYGNYLAVGASGQDSSQGAVYGYDKTDGPWKASLNNPLYEPVRAANNRFGNQFSIYGTYLIIGSHGDSSTAANAGAAYIFALGDY